MKKALFLVVLCGTLSCQNTPAPTTDYPLEEKYMDSEVMEPETLKVSPGSSKLSPDEFWANRNPSSDRVQALVSMILNSHNMSEENSSFLKAIASDTTSQLAIQRPIAPVFRLTTDELGVYVTDVFSKKAMEPSYFSSHFEYHDSVMNSGQLETLVFSPNQEKVEEPFYIYSDSGSQKVMYNRFGLYAGPCLEYGVYTLDLELLEQFDSFLFASPFNLDLVYETHPIFDSILIQNADGPYFDCPSNEHLFKTFARLKGTTQLYFVYADTFPVNNTDYPTRALVYFEPETLIPVFLWIDGIDLFGCPCL